MLASPPRYFFGVPDVLTEVLNDCAPPVVADVQEIGVVSAKLSQASRSLLFRIALNLQQVDARRHRPQPARLSKILYFQKPSTTRTAP